MASSNSLDRLPFWRFGRRKRAARRGRRVPSPNGARDDLIVVRGLGGRLEVDGHLIRIRRGGAVAFLLTLLGYRNAFMEKSIWIDRLSTIDIIRPEWSLDFIRFCYPGSPELTGRGLQDALADNALLLNPFDHRGFYVLKRRLEALMRTLGERAPMPRPGAP